MKSIFLEFNPVADLQFSAPPRFQCAVYFDHAIQNKEFCFNAVLSNIGKLEKLGKTDALGTDDNFWHVSPACGFLKKTARDKKAGPWQLVVIRFC
jgi:hypothetical protein